MSPAMALCLSSPLLRPLSNYQGVSNHGSGRSSIFTSKPGYLVQNTRPSFSRSVSMTDGQSGDHGKVNLDHMMGKARKYWDELPQPVKSFPWNRVLDNFLQLIFDVAAVAIKYLSAPVFAVSSISEMSYCAHERKLFFVPVPLVLGFVVAGILKETGSELPPITKGAEVPWRWIAIAILFVLLKLPGPYYPYWGRVFIPHFANGGLLRVFWMMYSWYRRSNTTIGGAELPQNVDG